MNIELDNPSNPDNEPKPKLTVFNSGFRIFFLNAGIFSTLSMILWATIFFGKISYSSTEISSAQWHAHEMIYGYTIAVIAGFLLTAVKNWTGIQTVSGKSLMFIFSLWLIARILFLPGISLIHIAGIFDILFLLSLTVAVSIPVIKVKQWKQTAILSKLLLLAVCNILFYLGTLGLFKGGIVFGIYGGLYLIIGLILTMSRRVVPFFIQNGVGYSVKLFNSRWVDVSSLVLFIGFFVTTLLLKNKMLAAYLALGLAIIHAIRLIGWYTRGIWSKSLLWSLYLSLWFIVLGFLLFAGSYFLNLSEFLAVHAFTVGGISTITLGMMSRVALGHTGRDINHPPSLVSYALFVLLLVALTRVILPLFSPQYYEVWVGLSQFLWIITFSLFSMVYLPLLTKPRADGQSG